ncbi:copper-binding protein [Photobacterium jeanii]|uniref:Copper-binding protein n=1 Tax=Photobacterium jeanii TaxID=858640 RepID=A0A178K192_9GAMM|nr:cupredoxin family protein [Photobacterium jeanii]OAN11099.1 copper-binding protein [Photobacterium jeanii]PST90614.1 copper-binding protein [Photobacterium jeanii]
MKKTLITLTLALTTTTAFAQMDHSNMNHSQMNHSSMNHSNVDHSKMDHSNMMDMPGMSAVGMPAKGAKPDKVVHVILGDDMTIKFKKDVKIEPNDVVQFVVMNTGKINHEFTIGSAKEQLEHREMMKTMSGDHMHDSGNAVTVAPGKAKQMLWHFHGDNKIEFACNIPGHAEAGMTKKITL